ncbi:MAG: pirin family protein [Pseudohongiellaceae bacterium]
MMKPQTRNVEEMLKARPASDGDGVRLLRVFGGGNLARFDPWLMLDEFGSNDARDYIGGFPPHPHRGFETVTYMLEGRMEHRDHMNNIGLLQPGDVQWMKAGSGVIHSEMPKQNEGRMRGFQLWLNLPAAEKMTPAAYEDISAASIPGYDVQGVSIKAIAGTLKVNGQSLEGRVRNRTTVPGYLDLAFGDAHTGLEIDVPDGHSALIYVYDGELRVGEAGTRVTAQHLVRMSRDGILKISGAGGAKALVITGKPIGEPIVQHGPFVMNSEAEIRQAVTDYQNGMLTDA